MPFPRLIPFLILLGCLHLPAAEVRFQDRQVWHFEEDGVWIDNEFPAARVNGCRRLGPLEYEIIIRPENSPINRSPWFGFRMRSREPVEARVRLQYVGATHRYHPKVSHDGEAWEEMEEGRISVSGRRSFADLSLSLSEKPLWISAQERLLSEDLDLQELARRLGSENLVEAFLVGRSVEGREIRGYTFGNRGARDQLVIIGRQHPPEVTGSLGLLAFVERCLGSDDLANSFRARHGFIVIPFINVDGVHHGHWRHNLHGVDLNRDWDRFEQPETYAVRDAILRKTLEEDRRVVLFFDFHSTFNDVFYTQKDSHPTEPPDFTRNWLEAIRSRFPDYPLRRSSSHTEGGNVSKSWAYDAFGCPSITYEFGDGTDRKRIQEITGGAAEEMMKLLLAEGAAGRN